MYNDVEGAFLDKRDWRGVEEEIAMDKDREREGERDKESVC